MESGKTLEACSAFSFLYRDAPEVISDLDDPDASTIRVKLLQPPALLLNSLAEKMTDITRSGLSGAILHLLITNHVIDYTEAEQVKLTPEGQQRASYLVGIISKKTHTQLKTFVDVLKTHCPSGYEVFYMKGSRSSVSPNQGPDGILAVKQTREVSELLTCLTNTHYGEFKFYAKLKAVIKSGIDVTVLTFENEFNLMHEVIRTGRLEFLLLIQCAGLWMRLYGQKSGHGLFSNLTPLEYAHKLGAKGKAAKDKLSKMNEDEHLLQDVDRCVREGHVGRFRELKQRLKNRILTSHEESSVLEYACQSGDLGMLREVIRTEQELGYRRRSVDKAVAVCVSLGHHTFLQPLMDYVKVDLNQIRVYGRTLIEQTAVSGDEDTFHALRLLGAQSGRNVAVLAAANNRLPFLESILSAGVLPFEDINFQDESGKTAAHIAAEKSNVGMLRLLLGKGLDITLTDKKGFSILHSAVSGGRLQVVEVVLEFCRRHDYLHTMLTARDRYLGADRCFLVWGNDGANPAWQYVIVDRARVEVFRKKVAEGRINVTYYGTILKSGCGNPAEVVKEIQEHYDVGTAEACNLLPDRQPLHLAIRQNHDDVALRLIREMEYVGQPGRHGLTPLHLAAMTGSLQVMSALLERGASIEAEDDQGRTPLDVAVANEKQEAVNLLMPAVWQRHRQNMRRKLLDAFHCLSTDNLEQQEDSRNYTTSVLRIVKAAIDDYEHNILGEGPVDVEPLD